eukprot:SAG11_NODE_35303_length_267_cov_0.619048_1_plen_66_part_01
MYPLATNTNVRNYCVEIGLTMPCLLMIQSGNSMQSAQGAPVEGEAESQKQYSPHSDAQMLPQPQQR